MEKYYKDIKEHIFMIKNRYQIINNQIKCKETYDGWINYANSNQDTRLIFSTNDFNLLLSEYESRLNMAVDIINQCANDDLEKMLCTLEFMRLMVTYEFICVDDVVKDENNKNGKHTFAGSGLNAAITGRGICQSQASYCRDILNKLGIEARFLPLYSKQGESHADVLIEETGVIDPTNYDGTIKSISGGSLYKTFNLDKYNDFTFINQNFLQKCKNAVQNELIKYLEIDKISDILGLNSKSNDEKQFIIWGLIAKNIVFMDKAINSYTVKLNGCYIEISNLLELFYKANNIPLKRNGYIQGKFEQESYPSFETIINNEKVTIVPRLNIFMGSNKKGTVSPFAYFDNNSKIRTYGPEIVKAKEYLDHNYYKIEDENYYDSYIINKQK